MGKSKNLASRNKIIIPNSSIDDFVDVVNEWIVGHGRDINLKKITSESIKGANIKVKKSKKSFEMKYRYPTAHNNGNFWNVYLKASKRKDIVFSQKTYSESELPNYKNPSINRILAEKFNCLTPDGFLLDQDIDSESLISTLKSTNRSTPIIYISKGNVLSEERFNLDRDTIRASLTGLALVYEEKSRLDRSQFGSFENELPYNGFIRIFFPGFETKDKYFFQPVPVKREDGTPIQNHSYITAKKIMQKL